MCPVKVQYLLLILSSGLKGFVSINLSCTAEHRFTEFPVSELILNRRFWSHHFPRLWRWLSPPVCFCNFSHLLCNLLGCPYPSIYLSTQSYSHCLCYSHDMSYVDHFFFNYYYNKKTTYMTYDPHKIQVYGNWENYLHLIPWMETEIKIICLFQNFKLS